MAGVRGRPRKVLLPEPSAITEDKTMLNQHPDLVGLVNPTDYTKPAIMHPRDVKPTPERMTHVLDKLAKFVERGFIVTPDKEGVSITITKGRCSEGINITSTDHQMIQCVNRVAVAAAFANGAK